MGCRIALLGATGLVGHHVLQLLLEDARVDEVIAPTRRPLQLQAPQLHNPVIDFERIAEAAREWHVDAAICALGSTMKQAGSREAFNRIDHDYPLAFAQSLRTRGCSTFALNSATGADPGSLFFYNKVKGELERDLATLGFTSLTLVRPGLIGGERAQRRPLEHAASVVLGVLGPVLPRGLRINPAGNIAKVLVEAALVPQPGEHVVSAAQLV